jgi:opacity protein-like surface antigen
MELHLKKTLTSLLITGAALSFSNFSAHAADDTYIGAAIGARTHYGLDCSGSASCDRNANSSGKIYFGRQLDKTFGVEVMAWKLGDAQGVVKNGSTSVAASVNSQGVAVLGVAGMSFDAFSLKARLGVGHARGRSDYSTGGSTAKNAFVPVLGVGASYALDKNWSLNADWDHLPARVNGHTRVKTGMFSLGASYRF